MNPTYSPDEVAERLAIRDVLVRYFRGVDHQDRTLMERCFTADVQVAINDKALPAGRDALMGFMFPADGGRPPRHMMHFMGQITIMLNGDTAETETYAYAHLTTERDGNLRMRRRGLRYLDSLRREDGEWRIWRRRHTAEWEIHETPQFVADAIATRAV